MRNSFSFSTIRTIRAAKSFDFVMGYPYQIAPGAQNASHGNMGMLLMQFSKEFRLDFKCLVGRVSSLIRPYEFVSLQNNSAAGI